MSNDLYPLQFEPRFIDKPWGGNRMKSFTALSSISMDSCGEAWLISGVPNMESVVQNGFLCGNELNELVEVYMEDLVGEKVYIKYGDIFPLLIKIIDTNDWLSVQVHPDDTLAESIHGDPFGKTEMWYILAAGSDAKLLNGLKSPVSAEILTDAIVSGQIKSLLNEVSVNPGDTFFTPAGRIHAIGPNITLAEIQQTSDYTYRLFDWGRTDKNGNSRELHISQGIQAANLNDASNGLTSPKKENSVSERLVECSQFITNRISMPAKNTLHRNYLTLDSFVIWLCIEGTARYTWANDHGLLQPGSCILIPASLDEIDIETEVGVTFLETYIRA